MLPFLNMAAERMEVLVGSGVAMRPDFEWSVARASACRIGRAGAVGREPARVQCGGAERQMGRWRWCLLLVFCWAAVPPQSLPANDVFYRTLMPQMLPPPQPLTSQPGLCNTLLDRWGINRVPRRVTLADRPRQAALAALHNPRSGVALAGYALAAGIEADNAQVSTSVDLYFETVAFSWNFLKQPNASAFPEYETAWQLYHNGLERLMSAAQRFGRLEPSRGLRLATAAGAVTLPTTYQGFVWKPEDFSRVEVVPATTPRKLACRYRSAGLGVPLVVVRERSVPERFFNDRIPFNATVVLRPSLAVLAGTAPPLGAESSHGPVEFYDPLRVSTVAMRDQQLAMATDTSLALEYAVRNVNVSPWRGVMEPRSAEAGRERLNMIEPRQPGKVPVVFVHGFFSSPGVWAEAANEILADPHLRDRYQLMAYSYPTGRPFLESAAILRRELTAFAETYDADGQDPSMSNMVIIGHSMGGLVAKLTVTHSDDRLWNSVAKRPLSDIKVSDEGRQRLANLFYFEPLPFVRRVVFVGTPHDGAGLASSSIGRLTSRCVEHPADEMIEHHLLIQANPDVFSPELAQRIPTSIDMLDPHSCLLRAIQTLCPGQDVQLHNIVGTACLSPLSGHGDGVVAASSAVHPWVSTEKRVHANHTGLHQDLESIREMRCILGCDGRRR